MSVITPVSTTGQAPVAGVTPETAVAPEVAKPEETKPEESARFAQMARREKMLRARAREIETREQALKAREAQYTQPQQPQAPDVSWKERLVNDPAGLLAEAGMSYDQFVASLANQNPLDPTIRQLQNELKQIKEAQNKVLEDMGQRDERAMSQAIKQIETEVGQIVRSNPDEYETLAASGPAAQKEVARYIKQVFDEEGYIMDVHEAAREVEEALTEQALGYAKLKKIQAKLSPSQVAAKAEVELPQAQAKGPSTLSHSMSAGSKPLSAKERAILAFQGKLQS